MMQKIHVLFHLKSGLITRQFRSLQSPRSSLLYFEKKLQNPHHVFDSDPAC